MSQAQDTTKARLLEAAGEEFAEKGFEGATIRAIIERAKANIAAVNYHFGDKEKLYVQAVIESHRCGVDMEPVCMNPADSAAEQLRLYVRHFLERVLAIDNRDSWHHKLMIREMLQPSHASETLVREVIRPKFERLMAILQRACPEADEKRLIASSFSIIGQCLHYKMARPIAERLVGPDAFAGLDLDYLTDHITGFSLAALGIGPPIGCGDRDSRTPVSTSAGNGQGDPR
ncbi:MAG: transcriptional regulator [Planctomycetota bacterium]|nr:transcriptional regulator [Planctomycetota bacterium]